MLAALDPGVAAACGFTWTFMMPISGVSALVAAVLCPFRRTAKQANRLSKVALVTGVLAFAAAATAVAGTTDWRDSARWTRRERNMVLQSLRLVGATALAPLVGFLAGRISRQRIEVRVAPVLPGWKRAHESLSLVLPIEGQRIPPELTPATIFEIADLDKVRITSGVIPRWDEHTCGPGLYSKMEVFDRMFASAPPPRGEVIVITPQCFPITSREPFVCDGETLRQWIAGRPAFIFDGDAIFIFPESRCISVFHHDGMFAHIHAAQSPRDTELPRGEEVRAQHSSGEPSWFAGDHT